MLTPPDELSLSHARELVWAVCPSTVTAVSFAADAPTGEGHSHTATEGVPLGSHCLLIDSKSHDASFYTMRGAEPLPPRRSCVVEIPQAAEALTGRTVDSCYTIGAHGTGLVEIVEFKHQSPKDMLAALLVDNLRTPPPDGPQFWIAKLPSGAMGWADGKFHPEQFQHLFTMVNDRPHEPSTTVRFVGIEWDGPEGTDLILYKPVGNKLKPVLVNHDHGAAPAMAQK